MNEIIKQLAKAAAEEQNPDRLAQLFKSDERYLIMAEIMGEMGSRKDEIGPIEFTLEFGMKCWELGKKEMKEFMGE